MQENYDVAKDFQLLDDMAEVQTIFKKVFDGKKCYGTDTLKMGFFHDFILCAKVEQGKIIFSLPFDGPMTLLLDVVKNTHYNRSDSIVAVCEVSEDNTQLTATYYWKEFKLFKDL